MTWSECTFPEHPHPGHPCGRQIVAGVTRCQYCGHLDDSPECEAVGCWELLKIADLLLDNLATGTDTWAIDMPDSP